MKTKTMSKIISIAIAVITVVFAFIKSAPGLPLGAAIVFLGILEGVGLYYCLSLMFGSFSNK